MRLTTRPRNGQSYVDYINQWADALVGHEEVTSASALTAEPTTPGYVRSTGRLAPEHHESFQKADYAVYSYATPIAWHVPSEGWVMPMDKYSLTTTQHQSHIRVLIEHYMHATLLKV